MATKSFSLGNYGAGGGGMDLSGIPLLKKDVESLIPPQTLAWPKDGSPGTTIFRPYGCPTDDHTGVYDLENVEDPGTVTPWVHPLPHGVKSAGTKRKITFNAALSAEDGQDFSLPPYQHLFNYYSRIAYGPESPEQKRAKIMTKGGQGRDEMATVPKPKNFLLAQGLLYVSGKKLFTPARNVTLLLQPSAHRSLYKLLFPDGAHIAEGFVDFFNPVIPRVLMFQSLKEAEGQMIPRGYTMLDTSERNKSPNSQNDESFTQGYACHLLEAPVNLQLPTTADNIVKFIDWENAVRVLTVKEQITLICSAYETDILFPAFDGSEFEDLLPDPVKRAFAARRSGEPGISAPLPAAAAVPPPAGRPAASRSVQAPVVPLAQPEPLITDDAPDESGESDDATLPVSKPALPVVDAGKREAALANIQKLRDQRAKKAAVPVS